MQLKEELKNTFTSYWSFMALRTACQLNLFDEVKKGNFSISEINQLLKTDYNSLVILINTLVELNTIQIIEKKLTLKPKGELLTESSPHSLKQACILWGGEHLDAWQNLQSTIKTGKPSFEAEYEVPFFNYLKTDKNKLYNYHKAMSEYAVDDYKNISKIIDFTKFSTITDIGGGLGVLINYIQKDFPSRTFNLLELPEVIDLVENEKNINLIKADFFKPLPVKSDLIILSRVLHDWDNEKAKLILNNCSQSITDKGKILIIEIMQDEINANLLSLNMKAICKSYERTYIQYEELIKSIGFKVSNKNKLNSLQTILTIERV